MNGYTRVAAIVATVVIVLVLAVGLGLFPSSQAPTAAAAPTASAPTALVVPPTPATTAAPSAAPKTASLDPSTATIDTSSWKTYRSGRYGFTIGYPADTTPKPATRDWTFVDDRTQWQTPAAEAFPTHGHTLLVTAWAAPAAPRSSLDTWIEAYCGGSCSTLVAQAQPIEFDGHPGKLISVPGDSVQAFALVDRKVYAIAAWEPSTESTVRAFASTMHIGS